MLDYAVRISPVELELTIPVHRAFHLRCLRKIAWFTKLLSTLCGGRFLLFLGKLDEADRRAGE